MWESSNHRNAIRGIARQDPSVTDCAGCHSSEASEARQENAADGSVQADGFHKISCLACHTRQESEFDHRVVMDPANLCDVCHFQRDVFWGKGARGIKDSRIYHSGVLCTGCHMTEGNHKMEVLRPDDPTLTEDRLDTCTACHMDNNREARVDQIQEYQLTYEQFMPPLLADVAAIEAALQKTSGLLAAVSKLQTTGG